jgi:hypothetical protein
VADVHRSDTVRPDEESGIVVVHCSDPRFQPHFQEFLRQKLGLDSYALVAVPGGPQFLTLAEYLPKFSWVGWRWMKFLMERTRPRRVILIGHHDCHWYMDGRFFHQHHAVADQQLADLRHVRDAIGERFGNLTIEAYFARLDGEEAIFEPVT